MISMPMIIEHEGRNKKAFDIPTKLYEKGIITLMDEIDDDVAYSVITQLLYLDTLESDESIKLYLNSPGGMVTAGLAILDTIEAMTRKVDIIAMGSCASMAAFLLITTTGQRRALKNVRIMLHSISGGFIGNYHDHKVNFKEEEFLQNSIMNMIAKKSKMTIDKLKEMTSRDLYMSAEEALEYGFIDSIV